MNLLDQQFEFAAALPKLLQFILDSGYQYTLGDAFAHDGHKKGSYHYKRLAIDINLCHNRVYLTETEDHREIGEYWKSLGGTWGGDWQDGNHYSWHEH